MKRVFLLVLIFSGVIFISCINRKLNTHLVKLKTEIMNLKTSNWDVINKYEDKEKLDFQLRQNVSDTLYNLSFIFYKEPNEELLLNHYKIRYFNIGRYDSTSEYFYFSELRDDTLFAFKSKKEEMIKKNFIVGKYYYLYESDMLTESQKRYFELHRDSLTKIRGDNLPELPGLE